MDYDEINVGIIELDKCLSLAKNESVSKLEKSNHELNLQLESLKKRCADLEQQSSNHIQETLNTEKKLTELECSYEEVKKDLEECSSKKQILLESKCDLEISVAESDVYAQVLQENLDEIEEVCTTLREQRDEQHQYFLQREVCLKNEFDQQIDKLKKEKALVEQSLSQIKLKEIQLNDELNFSKTKQKDWRKEKEKLKDEIANSSLHIKKLEDDLRLEKDTVTMLLEKNNRLAAEVLYKKSDDIKTRNHSPSLSKETALKIEELVNEFYEKRAKSCSDANEKRINELSQKVSECEKKLAEEKRLRRDAEIKSEVLQDELRRTKSNADSLMQLNVARCRNSLSQAKPTRKGKINFNIFENLLDTTHHGNSLLDLKVSAILREEAMTAGGDTALVNVPPADRIVSDQMLFEAANDVSNSFVPSSKSAERIQRANERAIEKLKKISL